jgi:hypothetical protein
MPEEEVRELCSSVAAPSITDTSATSASASALVPQAGPAVLAQVREGTSNGIIRARGGVAGAGPEEKRAAPVVLRAGTRANGVLAYTICDDAEQPGLQGGQGEVYQAYGKRGRSGSKSYVVVKEPVDRTRLARQAREAQVYFNIDPNSHPHLAYLSDVVRHEGTPLLVMDWAEQGSLNSWLQAQAESRTVYSDAALPSPADKEALEFAIQIARGLVSIHTGLHMVHQDLKPGNVLRFGNLIKIADFGLCCSNFEYIYIN